MVKRVVHDKNRIPIVFWPFSSERLYLGRFNPLYVRKSQQDGERDLVELARKEELEASWLYCHDDSTWYCICAISERTKRGLRVVDYPFDYSQLGRRFSKYHTHPIAEVLSALPSTGDIKSALKKLGDLSRGTLDFKIVSRYSITDMDITKVEKEIPRNYARELSNLPPIVQDPTETLIQESISILNERVKGVKLQFRLAA